jgi:hypothetical protein
MLQQLVVVFVVQQVVVMLVAVQQFLRRQLAEAGWQVLVEVRARQLVFLVLAAERLQLVLVVLLQLILHVQPLLLGLRLAVLLVALVRYL